MQHQTYHLHQTGGTYKSPCTKALVNKLHRRNDVAKASVPKKNTVLGLLHAFYEDEARCGQSFENPEEAEKKAVKVMGAYDWKVLDAALKSKFNDDAPDLTKAGTGI